MATIRDPKGRERHPDDSRMKGVRNSMRKQMTLSVTLGILLALLDGACSAGIAVPSSAIRSLAGVKAVRIVAEDLSMTMQKTGLRKEQLEGTVAEALHKNGFVVLGKQEAGKVPLVYVRLSSVFANDEGAGPVSFYITLQIKQPAALLSEGLSVPSDAKPTVGEAPLLVTTWESGTMAMVNPQELHFYVKQTLLNLIGDLARDHQEANTTQVSESR